VIKQPFHALSVLIPARTFQLQPLRAQLNPGDPLSGLERLKSFESRRASSSDTNWVNGNDDRRCTSAWTPRNSTGTPRNSSRCPSPPVTNGTKARIEFVPYSCSKFRVSMFPVTPQPWEDQAY